MSRSTTMLISATGAYGKAVAEHSFAMLLMLQKKLNLYRDAQKKNEWRGTKSGMLPGILFDRMEIMDGENRSVRIDRPVVAVSKEPLFFRKDFTMILPESLFTDKL